MPRRANIPKPKYAGPLQDLKDEELAAELVRRGYVVKREASPSLGLHMNEPVPENFEALALEKIKREITVAHLEISTREFAGQTIRSATLRIV